MKKIVTLSIICVMLGCGNNKEEQVKSPFSHLDTVKTKVEEKKEEPKKDDGTSFSPFDNIKK